MTKSSSLDNNNNTNETNGFVGDSINKKRKPSQESRPNDDSEIDENNSNTKSFDLNTADAFLFHSPYCKLVQKSFARLVWNDYLDAASFTSDSNEKEATVEDSLKQFR